MFVTLVVVLLLVVAVSIVLASVVFAEVLLFDYGFKVCVISSLAVILNKFEK
jgi:hypothetical protein